MQTRQDKLYDVESVRKDALDSVSQGSVTKDYPRDVARACELLNEALASEIMCVLRYRHHEVIAKGINFPQVADEFAEHAVAEERHMMMIAQRIDQLGGNPDFNPHTVFERSATQYGGSTVLTEMIKEDLVEERVVIEIYRKLAHWFGEGDPTSRRMVEQMLAEEEEHANDLAALLETVDGGRKSKDGEPQA
jgi:bacterioferritin